jgi:acetylglutamate kinase
MPITRPNAPDQDVSREIVVLKIGGSVRGETGAVLAQVAALHEAGHPLVVVHGGGPQIGEWSARLGLETRFIRGLRVTDVATRDVAIAVLGGLANKTIAAALLARGVPAVGLSGIDAGMLRAEREDEELGLVGRVSLVDSSLIDELLAASRVPVVAPAALDRKSEILNVNGDAAAGAIAASLPARLLAFVTDVPGVLDRDGRTIAVVDPAVASELIDDGTIAGGMIPKVQACVLAASTGCAGAIVSAREPDAVERLLSGERVGTSFPAVMRL